MTTTLERLDIAILVIGSVWLLVLLTRWATSRTGDPLRSAPDRPNRLTPELVLVPILLWMSGLYGIEAAIDLLVRGQASPAAWATGEVRSLISVTAAQMLGAIACLVIGRRCFAHGWAGFGLSARKMPGRMIYGALVLLAIWPVLYGVHAGTTFVLTLFDPEFTPPAHQVLLTLDDRERPAWLAGFLWLSAVLIAPLAEELFFRGVIQTSLVHYYTAQRHRLEAAPAGAAGSDRAPSSTSSTQPAADQRPDGSLRPPKPVDDLRSRWLPILVTAAVFGVIHFPQPQAVPTLVCFAVAMGYAYHRTGSLIPSMTMHVLFNLKTMIFHTLITTASS